MSRGEYRSLHTVLLDGPDFQQLTPEARWLYIVCRMSVGASGIDVVPGMGAALRERSGLAGGPCNDALVELVGAGWVETDGNLLWVVRGLEFEPSFRATNAGHRKALRAHLAGLPRRAILDRFRARYARWLDDEDGMGDAIPPATPLPPDSHPDGMGVKGEGEGSREKGEGEGGGSGTGLPPDVLDALAGYLRMAPYPRAVRVAVAGLLDPRQTPHYSPNEVARALLEMQAGGYAFKIGTLTRWCGTNRAPPPTKRGGSDFMAGLERIIAEEGTDADAA